jgi:hypothetical protein
MRNLTYVNLSGRRGKNTEKVALPCSSLPQPASAHFSPGHHTVTRMIKNGKHPYNRSAVARLYSTDDRDTIRHVELTCSNAARLSNFPGHFREGQGQYQTTLFLSSFKEKMQ